MSRGEKLREPSLRDELLAMAARPAAATHADRLWAILDDYECWPGIRLVGADGEEAAWLIAQLGDLGLQQRCLELLEIAVEGGDAPPAHLAALLDRVRMAEGREQVYGTQFVASSVDTLEPWPIAAPETVEARRHRVGLPPLAQQQAAMNRRYRS
ncbi:MAG: hypothetical protein E6G60_03040 [Actinobacteria bacterium]|nr:MAG: hypothetical protein E6G60_03040 [Actinomycetota bacterium]